MAQTVFRIQELCDQILHHLPLCTSSHNDLKSAALVCHTLCHSAQSQIFRHVILDPYHPLFPLLTNYPARRKRVSAVGSLSAVLTASPHLLRFIRNVSTLAEPTLLKALSTITFPVLRNICFNFSDMTSSDSDVVDLARDLIGLPSIREVELIELGRCAGLPSLSWARFASLFEMCTQSLDSVALKNVILPSPPFTADPPAGRAQIKRLMLDGTKNLDTFLVSSASPFDFAQLVDVDTTHHGRSSPLVQLLKSARLTITHLRISGNFASELNLSDFPAMTCLRVDDSSLVAIPSLSFDNSLEILIFHFNAHILRLDYDEPSYVLIDALANSLMPVLRHVEVRIFGRLRVAFDLASVKSYFPQLESKGLLVVTDHRGAYLKSKILPGYRHFAAD
ncbi:hypothetical protein DFH09DRAFT_1396267, partial [Mycena vulgaris]